MDKINIFKGYGDKFSVNNVSKSLLFLMVTFAIIGFSGVVTGAVVVIGECNDGIDNDGDNRTDWQDPGCYITDGQNETGGTQCDDQIDNDGDGWIDLCVMPGGTTFNVMQDGKMQQCTFPWGDIGCQITHGQNETGGTDCDDGIDNDNDALIDVADPGCMVTNYQNETGNTQCSDGIDNDGDGAVDMLDQGCYSPWWNNETNMLCSDELDNDGDGLIDMNDPGCMGLWDNDETDPQCSDGLDNDGDGLIDFPADPGCMYAGDDDEFNPTPPPDNVHIGSSGSVWNYSGVPMVHWQDQITIKKSLNSSDIIWVEIIITPDSGGTISGSMTDMGQDLGNLSNHIYSITFTPYPAHGATHIQIIEHRTTTGDTIEDFSIYIDPSGWIYDSVTGDHIAGANVTLYYENPQGSGNFIPVPVQKPAIMLPNVTSMLSDATGHYGWDVIPGNYTVKISAPGYYPNNSVRIVTIPPAVLDLNVYLKPIINGKLKTTLAFVNNSPPYIEWLDVNLTGKLVTKCAVACDNNSVDDIADVEGYIYNPSGMLIDHEYLMLAPVNSICWQMVTNQDQHFFDKFNMSICDLYEGNYTLPDNAPNGTYTVIVEVNDTSGEEGNMTDYFNYTPENHPPFVEWMWLLPDEDNFTNGTQVYPVPGGSKTVTKCVIACDPDGVNNIADVEAEVYYPDGMLKEHEYLHLAPNSICWQTIPPEDAVEFQHKYNEGICDIYKGNITMEFWEQPGDYRVEVEVNDTNGTYGYMNDTFEYMPCIAIDNDANLINFGSVVPGSSSQVMGDNNMTTLNALTVRNICNVPANISVTGTNLSCITPATCDAAIIPVPTIGFDTGVYNLTIPGIYGVPTLPIETGPMSTNLENFRINIPLGALPGSYQGTVIIAGIKG